AVSATAPGCEVYAFEANTATYLRCKPKLAHSGIDYRHLAITDHNGQATVYMPVTLGGLTDNTRYSAKTSLLQRNEAAVYPRFEVHAQTLDTFFGDRLGAGARFFLWIDVEGATEAILAGALNVLCRTLSIFVECENAPFWCGGSNTGRLVDRLLQHGFIP